jgi:hypothetical protein
VSPPFLFGEFDHAVRSMEALDAEITESIRGD